MIFKIKHLYFLQFLCIFWILNCVVAVSAVADDANDP
jgi:hypothetical protein